MTESRKELSIEQAKKLLKEIFLYNLEAFDRGERHDSFIVPFFVGDPGEGKTAIPKQVARELSATVAVPYFQTIVAQFDPGQLAGLPFMGEVDVTREMNGSMVTVRETRMIRLRPTYLPDISDESQKIGIYNLDELPQTTLAGQNIMSQLVNEWRIGEHLLSQGITICCTGNKPENKAGTVPMPAHLKDRLMYIYIKSNPEEWLRYAAKTGIDGLVRTWIRQHPDKLSKFTPGADANPTPRSWEKISNTMKLNLDNDIRYAAFCGQIGEGQATEFEAFMRVKDRLPDPDEVIAHPDTAHVFQNKDADVLQLLLSSLADKATKANIGNILKYLDRLPNKEFAAVFVQDCFTRAPELMNEKPVMHWKATEGAKLFF